MASSAFIFTNSFPCIDCLPSQHRNHGKTPSGPRGFVGFKLYCVKNTPPKTPVPFNGKKTKKSYGGILPSILKSLESQVDVENALSAYVGKLGPKEQTVILKELGNWERVVRVFNWMKSQNDYVPNVIHYNVVLRKLCRARRWDELRLCWIEMAKDGVLPTNNTYSMLISEYGQAGLVSEALLWVRHMRVRGVFPDEVTMSTVVKVLKDAGEFERADRFYKDWCVGKVDFKSLGLDGVKDEPISLKNFLSTELFKIGGRSSTSDGAEMEENVVRKPQMTATYNTLIDLYGKAGRLIDAAEMFSLMLKSGVGPDTITFNTMIHICGSHGHLMEAEALLNKMEERGISPDTKTYNTFLSLYAEAGNVDAALQWYWKVRNVGLLPDVVTHRAVLNMLCKMGMIEEAETVLLEMEKCNLKVDEHSIPGIINMYVAKGLLDRARTFFETWKANNKGISSKTYAAIMDVYAEKGLSSEAEAVFHAKRDLEGQSNDVLEYNVMIKAFGKAKHYEKAFSIFKGMRNSGTWPDECTYNSLIQMLAGGYLVDHAKEVLNQMQEAGLRPHVQTYSAMIAIYARLGLLSEAVETFQDMERVGLEPNEVVYGALVDGFAETGRTDEALHYYRRMKDSGITANQIILTSLMKAYGKGGYLEEAKKIYESLKRFEGGPDTFASNCLISVYAFHGVISEAKLIFQNLRQKGKADGGTYATMMNLYMNLGMVYDASEVAEEMKSSGLLTDCKSFTKVMSCYATIGRLADCGALLHDMIQKKILPDRSTFKVFFRVLKRGRIPSEAVQQLQTSYKEGRPHAMQAVIACVFAVVGFYAFALKFCDAFAKGGVKLDPFAYNVAIYVYGACGHTDRALNMLLRMQDERLEPDIVTYLYLVDCYGRASMLEGVKRIYSLMSFHEIEANESLYKAIVRAYRNANRRDLAELVIRQLRLRFGSDQYSESDVEEEYSESDVEEADSDVEEEYSESDVEETESDVEEEYSESDVEEAESDVEEEPGEEGSDSVTDSQF